MSFGSFLKSAVNIVGDFIPGGGLIKAAVNLAIPDKKMNFGQATQTYNVGGSGMVPATIPAASTFGSAALQTVSQSLPPLAIAGVQATTAGGAGGLPVPWWKGPGGKLQMPGSDPRIPDYLKQFALDDAYLKPYYRAPKGYVVLRDGQGRPFAVNKAIARSMGLWKPSAKPPISATDYKHFKRNKTIEKKLKKIAGPLLRKHTTRSSAPAGKRK